MPRFQPGDYIKAELRDKACGEREWMWVVVDFCNDETSVLSAMSQFDVGGHNGASSPKRGLWLWHDGGLAMATARQIVPPHLRSRPPRSQSPSRATFHPARHAP